MSAQQIEAHTSKYLGEGEHSILQVRKAKFLRFVYRMIGYPARIDFDRYKMPTDKSHKIIKAAEAGLIPWISSKRTPNEYLEHWQEKNVEAKENDSGFRQIKSRPWGEYFYTNFFGIAPKLILLSQEEVEKQLEALQGSPDVSRLPQDGSRGQARAARKFNRLSVEWFLGEWDGEYTDWESNTEVGETF